MADFLTDEQIDGFQEMFRDVDKDGDGCITEEEVLPLIVPLYEKRTDEELHDMIAQVDIDGNGLIKFPEFLILMANKIQDTLEVLQKAFNLFDEDKNGYISANELKHMMISLGVNVTDEESKEMIGEIDLDGDGQINYNEFVEMMMTD